ncbi:myrosinase 1-like [Anoplophora glabripennis]|uniref:myrosinase 1-like n=1 Tax=Anoplophora glabripennis TaxID=217634 RepID=UPI000C76F340|nr:myrosinase 1-like [Anoplophora glabripennis]
MKATVLIVCLLSTSLADDPINTRYFPKDFKFGVANAATQIEGGWNEDGKGETIWDYLAHNYPEKIADSSTPEIASDSYHKYKEDVALVKAMGLDYYRLSIAWSRILPTGHPDKINQAGVRYYKNLFAELKAAEVEPMVTLYHLDLPQPLQDEYGGWLNETVVDLFAEYARICFELFKDDVKMWITINEPKQVCHGGYGTGAFAPGVVSNGVGEYICAKNVILAHAKAYHIYDDEFRATNQGRISIVIDTPWYEPGSDSEEDQEAAERIIQFSFGLYGNPIFVGDWPQVVVDRISQRSELEGFTSSRLPAFTDEEIAYVKGTNDYLGVNHYSTSMVNATTDSPIGDPSYGKDMSVLDWAQPDWPTGADGDYQNVVPWGMRHLLVWLKKNYGDVEIVITENGLSDSTGILEDDHRISYYQDYLSACLDAIYEDGVNLSTYLAWSIIDDWEFNAGYTSFLGMHYVNFTDPERTRIPRKSASWFTNMVATRCLVDTCVE